MKKINYKQAIWKSIKHALIVIGLFLLFMLVLGRSGYAYGWLNSSNYGNNVNITIWVDDFTGSPAAKCYDPAEIRKWLSSNDGSCASGYHWKCFIDTFTENTLDSRVGDCFDIDYSVYVDFSNKTTLTYIINQTKIDMSTAGGNPGSFDVTIYNTSDTAYYSNATQITGFTSMTTASFVSVSGVTPSYFIINISNTTVRYLKLFFHNKGAAMIPREIAFYGEQTPPPDSETPNCNISYPSNNSFINSNFQIYGNSSDNMGIISIISNDTTFNIITNITSDSGKTMRWNITNSTAVENKAYSVNITFIDLIGNQKSCISNFTIDIVIPSITLIEPVNNALYKNDSAIFSLLCSDDNLFGFDFMIWNTTSQIYRNSTRNLSTTAYQLNVSMNFTAYQDNFYNVTASCIDGHTGMSILDKTINITSSSISADDITIKSDSDSLISYKKEIDRYTYIFITNSSQQHIFTLTSGKKIYFREKSNYKGHFITGNSWIDTEPYQPDKIIRVNDFQYKIYLTGKEFRFNSIGDLNNNTVYANYAIDMIGSVIKWSTPVNNSILNTSYKKSCVNLTFYTFSQPADTDNCTVSIFYPNLTTYYTGIILNVNDSANISLSCVDVRNIDDGIYNISSVCVEHISNLSYTEYTYFNSDINVNISSPFEVNLTWKYYPINGTQYINHSSLDYEFELYSNNDSFICTFYRNDTNISSASYSSYISILNNITENYADDLYETYGYFVTCNFNDFKLNTSLKEITIKNSKLMKEPDTLTTAVIKIVYIGIMALLFLIHFVLAIIGFSFGLSALVLMSGVLGIIASIVALFMIGNIIGVLGYMFFVAYIMISLIFIILVGFSKE